MSNLWRGTFTALVTPFSSDGTVDREALRRLVDRQIDEGVEGIVPCGTTGEAATLTNEEHLQVVGDVVTAAAGRATILAGVGGNNTRNVIRLAQQSVELGVDGILTVVPYYNKPTQAGMLAHFTTIADAVDIPIILYNVPSRTSSNLEPATVLRLAAHRRIEGIKEASGSLDQAMEILAGRPEGFRVLSGEDQLTLAMICMGGDGVVSVVSNEVPRAMGDMVRHALGQELEAARTLHYRLLDLIKVNFIETNPVPAKAALAMMGLIEEHYRLPLVPMSAGNRALLGLELAALDLIGSP